MSTHNPTVLPGHFFNLWNHTNGRTIKLCGQTNDVRQFAAFAACDFAGPLNKVLWIGAFPDTVTTMVADAAALFPSQPLDNIVCQSFFRACLTNYRLIVSADPRQNDRLFQVFEGLINPGQYGGSRINMLTLTDAVCQKHALKMHITRDQDRLKACYGNSVLKTRRDALRLDERGLLWLN